MPTLAGWLTGEQVSLEVIEQTLTTMQEVLTQRGGTAMRFVQPGIGLVTFNDPAYAMQGIKEQSVLDWSPDLRTFVYRRPLSGLHPLYYIEDWPAKGNLLFASEIKALLALGMPRRLHIAAIDALLRYGFIPAPWTAFQNIFVVPAGSILRWNHARTMINHASDFSLEPDALPEPVMLTPSISAQFDTQLQQACADILPPHTDLVTLSGGGYASGLTTIMASQHTDNELTVAALGMKARHAKAWRRIQKITQSYNLPLLTITGIDQPEFWATTLTALEMPCSNTGTFAFHQLTQTVRAETAARVAMTGLGARLLTGLDLPPADDNHPPSTQQPSATTSQDMLHHYRQMTGTPTPPTRSLWSNEAQSALSTSEKWEDTLHARKLMRHAQQMPQPRQGLYYLDLHLRLPDGVIQPHQQIATYEGMVQRSPYQLSHIMNMLINMTINSPMGNSQQLMQTLFSKYLPDLTNLPSLPLAIPTPSLTSLDESDFVKEMLSTESIRQIGLFQPDVVQQFQQQSDKSGASSALLTVFTTQVLYHLFTMEGWA